MVKVITFSLWGDKQIYNIGAIKNVELAKQYYPDFECWFYIHSPSVPENTIIELKKHENVKFIFKYGDLNTTKPETWRFEAIDDHNVEVMMSRDTDTRILLREKLAVDEWLESGKLFHIMRDHPFHKFPIQAGMFGTKKNNNISSWNNLIKDIKQNCDKGYDQHILQTIFYPIIKNDSLIHASFNILNGETGEYVKKFPIPYCEDYHFVGEYVYEDESRYLPDSNVIKNYL
jgi:hypothetical protein